MNTIERKAINFVIKYERAKKRYPEDVSKKLCGYDVKSKGRYIEVKGFKNVRYPVLSLHKSLKRQLRNKIHRYHIYIVYNIDNSPRLKILKPDIIAVNLEIDTRYIIRGKVYRHISDEL